MSESIILTVVITVNASKVDEFLKYLKPVYEAAIAEPECTFFEVRRSPVCLIFTQLVGVDVQHSD